QNNSFVFLLNDKGEQVHQWYVDVEGIDAFLMENGDLVISAPRVDPIAENDFASIFPWVASGGSVMRFNWDGELLWQYQFDRPNYRLHHGIFPRANGNVLMIAWEYKTLQEA